MENRRPPEHTLTITAGDPAGIGPELVCNSLPEFLNEQSAPVPTIVFDASGVVLSLGLIENLNALGLKASRLEWDSAQVAPPLQGTVSIVSPGRVRSSLQRGEGSIESGSAAFASLRRACDFIEHNRASMLVTAPIAKNWIERAGVAGFRGHTDYLAERFRRNVLMVMHGDIVSTVPLTIHVPLRDVPAALLSRLNDESLVASLLELRSFTEFASGPWALCGLNPHAGEDGLLGQEEKALKEWCDRLNARGLVVEGPLAADTVFMEPVRDRYRLVLACYHDQGLGPFKALHGMQGVNWTVGLPFVRTSPDHGTAYDLVGSDKEIQAESMQAALQVAQTLAHEARSNS